MHDFPGQSGNVLHFGGNVTIHSADERRKLFSSVSPVLDSASRPFGAKESNGALEWRDEDRICDHNTPDERFGAFGSIGILAGASVSAERVLWSSSARRMPLNTTSVLRKRVSLRFMEACSVC
jgi:hypothetical protein